MPELKQSVEQRSLPLDAGIDVVAAKICELLGSQLTAHVAVAGGNVSGKTGVVVPRIAAHFDSVAVLSEDDYNIGLSRSAAMHGQPDLLTPEDYQPSRMILNLAALRNGRSTSVPTYHYGRREPDTAGRYIEPVDVVLAEGAYLLQPHFENVFDLKVFVEADDHSRFIRRMLRMPRQFGQSLPDRLWNYMDRVYPSHYRHVEPYMPNADIVISNPFNIEEAAKLLRTSDDIAEVSREVAYTHPAMTGKQRISVAEDLDGLQILAYTPDTDDAARRLTIAVPVGERKIDLTRIGYTVVSSGRQCLA